MQEMAGGGDYGGVPSDEEAAASQAHQAPARPPGHHSGCALRSQASHRERLAKRGFRC